MKKVDIDNARNEEQTNVMRQIIAAGDDPFSAENLEKYHKKPILIDAMFWKVTENQWPYPNIAHHFLLIHKENVSSLEEVSGEAFKELLLLSQQLIMEFNIPGGALAMRFGETNRSGATVVHFHAQLICPKEGEQSIFYIGSQKTK
jgi:diadenosine tetraphosphate (Ap4A) HIT family hydrolase